MMTQQTEKSYICRIHMPAIIIITLSVMCISCGGGSSKGTSSESTPTGSTVSGSPYASANPGIAVTGIALDKASLSMTPGGYGTLKSTVTPSDASDPSIVWTSDPAGVVSIRSDGLVIGQSAGSAVIKASSASVLSIYATCTVTVAGTDNRSDATFTALSVSSGTLQPSLNSVALDYLAAPIPYEVTSATAIIKPADARTTVTVNGADFPFGTDTYTVNVLSIGPNPISIKVTAADGTIRTYSLTLYRSVPVWKTGAATATSSGDDGSTQRGVSWPANRFTDGTEILTDTMTGLVWHKDYAGYGSSVWSTKISNLDAATLAGVSDWRMPNIRELMSLINYGVANPAAWLTSQGFTSVPTSSCLSSTTRASVNTNALRVIFTSNGGSDATPKTGSGPTIAVRSTAVTLSASGQTTSYTAFDDGAQQKGLPLPAVRFRDNGNGTMTDNMTGLIWLKNANTAAGLKSWSDALAAVTALNADAARNCGYTDWCLPNAREMESLLDYERSDNASQLVAQGFTNVTANRYWTSTAFANGAVSAYYTDFQICAVYPLPKTNTYYVWPVRASK